MGRAIHSLKEAYKVRANLCSTAHVCRVVGLRKGKMFLPGGMMDVREASFRYTEKDYHKEIVLSLLSCQLMNCLETQFLSHVMQLFPRYS